MSDFKFLKCYQCGGKSFTIITYNDFESLVAVCNDCDHKTSIEAVSQGYMEFHAITDMFGPDSPDLT